MNLEDVIDPDYGLQQDDWSLTKPTFGEEGQLEVVGWSGRSWSGNKCYILYCSKCAQDGELFGDGYFKSTKSKNSLLSGRTPCGCGRTRWTQDQLTILCPRLATALGYTLLEFGKWAGQNTKIKMSCPIHGDWSGWTINHLINSESCPVCEPIPAKVRKVNTVHRKRDDIMIASFFASGTFHPDTKFSRSDRLDSQGYNRRYWYMTCGECGETGEGQQGGLQQGKRPCACSPMRQQECYINYLIDDHNNMTAIKFGIANNSKQRCLRQGSNCAYTLKQHAVYKFPSVQQCKQAERECKKELECGVVLKRDMPDGWTETTWSYNIGKVVDIYKRNGGVLV